MMVALTFDTLTFDDLKQDKQWICYTQDKKPCDPRTGYGADCNDPASWGFYDEAMSVFRQENSRYLAVGRMFVRADGITGIDLDSCIDEDGNLTPFARRVIQLFNSYTEYSPSGHGIHIWVRGILPKNIDTAKDLDGDESVEAYDSKRGFTITDNHLSGTPTKIEYRQVELLTFHTEITERRRKAKEQREQQTSKKAGSSFKYATQTGGNTRYGMKALDDECQRVRTMPEGGRNSQLNTSAFALGQLIAGGQLERATVENDLYNAAARAGLSDREIEKTLRSGLEAGVKEPRSAPALEGTQEYTPAVHDHPATNGSHANGTQPPPEKEDSQAQKLVNLAMQYAEQLFMTPKGQMYIRLRVNGHIETMLISERGGGFKRWLIHSYRETNNGTIPNANALTQAIGALEAEAQWGVSPRQEIYVRLAHHDGKLYLDLANEACEVVEISENGWKMIENPPVCFRRPEGMLPLPTPVHVPGGGSLDDLRRFINIADDDWLLLKAFILGMMHPTGPYPILSLNGERGSAKTSAARRVRSLIDPHQAPLRKESKDDQTFAVMAHNNYVVAFDNLSHISSHFSDLMCTLSTGAGDAYRKHYSNDEECIFSTRRPQIFTGIEELATRGDLIDRCIMIRLPVIEETKRRDERTLDREFEEAHPRILGALLDAVSLALRNLPQTHIEKLPRMADFALWVQAAEGKLTPTPGAFLTAYKRNQEEGIATEIEASPIGNAIIAFMSNSESWDSTSTDLLDQLKKHVTEEITHQKSWPKNARALSGAIKRLAPSLRAKGLHVRPYRGNDGGHITITSDANFQKSDANFQKSDAKMEGVTQKNSGLRHSPTQVTGGFTDSVTQSDANIPLSPSPVQKEKEKAEEVEGIRWENAENLRHFASLTDEDYEEI